MQPITEIQPVQVSEPSGAPPALIVDLDGTLVKTDLLLESLLALLRQNLRYMLCLPLWLLKGRAYFKHEIARRISLDVDVLPYREKLLAYLRVQRAEGRTLVLATACDKRIARQVADHLKLFDSVFASDGDANLSGEFKRDCLVNEFGERGFDYAGNDRRDRVIWASARKAIVVNPGRLGRFGFGGVVAQVDEVFDDQRRGLSDYLNPLRPQHWLKNLLVFVLFLAAHRMYELGIF